MRRTHRHRVDGLIKPLHDLRASLLLVPISGGARASTRLPAARRQVRPARHRQAGAGWPWRRRSPDRQACRTPGRAHGARFRSLGSGYRRSRRGQALCDRRTTAAHSHEPGREGSIAKPAAHQPGEGIGPAPPSTGPLREQGGDEVVPLSLGNDRLPSALGNDHTFVLAHGGWGTQSDSIEEADGDDGL